MRASRRYSHEPESTITDGAARFTSSIFENISLTVRCGERFVIVGGSGCGKTTLLRHLIGLQRPVAGRVVVDGEEISAAEEDQLRRLQCRIGVLLQAGALFISLTLGSANVCRQARVFLNTRSERFHRRQDLVDGDLPIVVRIGQWALTQPVRPSSIIARSTITKMLGSSCDTTTLVVPRLRLICTINASSSAEVTGSSPADGSSKNRTLGSSAIARARAARFESEGGYVLHEHTPLTGRSDLFYGWHGSYLRRARFL
jgi:hypothetical protein